MSVRNLRVYPHRDLERKRAALMIVTCEKCAKRFDDEFRWTICPHNPLDVPAGKVLCLEHDLFDCPFHPGSEHLTGMGRVKPADES
jgi:hypothetical protein